MHKIIQDDIMLGCSSVQENLPACEALAVILSVYVLCFYVLKMFKILT